MKFLVLGSGGREHVFCWKLSQEVGVENVFVYPGNGGTKEHAVQVQEDLSSFEKIAEFCNNERIDVLIPGSEAPIVDGIFDFITGSKEPHKPYVFSPNKLAAQLEGSKEFAKEFMLKYNVPTADYQSFTLGDLENGLSYLETLKAPYVLKADGLAAGKGVLILNDLQEAKAELTNMLKGKFGEASSKVVIEEFLDGIEFSVFAMVSGGRYVMLPEAKDYKRILENDEGLNTGGMGACSPVPFCSATFMSKVEKEIIKPTVDGLNSENYDYQGFVFFGLIKVGDEAKVIEYNVRMGDPETEVVIPRMNTALSVILSAFSKNQPTPDVSISNQHCTTVFAVSKGYPENYEKGKEMVINPSGDGLYFHAGTKDVGGLKTSGGRVIACTGLGNSLKDALSQSYQLVDGVTFEGKTYRTDIGQDLLKYQKA